MPLLPPRAPVWMLRRQVRGFPVGDLVGAAFVLLVAVASVLAGKPDEGPLGVTLPVAVVVSSSLAWRTRNPVVAAIAATAAGLTQAVVADQPGALWAFAVFLVLTYSVAAWCEEGRAAVGGAVLVGGLMLMERFDNGVDYVFIVLVFGGAWLLGRGTREWRGRATFAEEHQRDVARLAVAEERVRIARELHDVVAHGLSVIAVQADAAEAALSHDPALAAAPLRAIRGSARNALTEMRQMLTVLRTTEDEPNPSRQPSPGVADLHRLVEGMRAAGLPVEATIGTDVGSLTPSVDLAVYRIVQEGLTNVVKHAGPVATSLVVATAQGQVEVRVSNRGGTIPAVVATGPGQGLIGIRERVSSVGGRFTAERSSDGGFMLSATLPDGRPSSGGSP